jgi:hypothetical protein
MGSTLGQWLVHQAPPPRHALALSLSTSTNT